MQFSPSIHLELSEEYVYILVTRRCRDKYLECNIEFDNRKSYTTLSFPKCSRGNVMLRDKHTLFG